MTNADFMGSSGSFAQGLMNGLSLDFDGDFDPTQYNSNTNSQDRKNDILHLRNNTDKANKVPEGSRDYRTVGGSQINNNYFEGKDEKRAAKLQRKAEKRAVKLNKRADKLEAKRKDIGDLRESKKINSIISRYTGYEGR